jgi:hypothetical protein
MRWEAIRRREAPETPNKVVGASLRIASAIGYGSAQRVHENSRLNSQSICFAFGEMTTLLEIIEQLPNLEASKAISAAVPWQPASLAIIACERPDGSLPAEARALSCRYFLDVAFCRAAMIGFRAWLKREPTLEESCIELIRWATKSAESDASPNGGPAQPFGKLGAGDGPPSVS